MQYTYNNITMYYKKYGNSNNYIIILPGWGDNRKTFNPITNNFSNNYTIYIFDYPSFGKSKKLNKTLTIYQYSNWFINFLNNFKIENPIIIAHSFGGRIASILIGKYNYQVNKLILFDVAGIKHKNIKLILKVNIYKLLKKTSYFIPYKLRNTYNKKLLNIFGSTDYKNIPVIMRDTFKNIINEDLKKYYKKINCSTLIIWGEKDYDTPLKDAFYLKKIIKDSALIIYKNSSHFSYMDNYTLTINILNNFI